MLRITMGNLSNDETLDRFLDCGDLHKGFARVHCDACGHEPLPAIA